jgi:hypothetical protein
MLKTRMSDRTVMSDTPVMRDKPVMSVTSAQSHKTHPTPDKDSRAMPIESVSVQSRAVESREIEAHCFDPDLYETDETAWLEAMSEHAARGDHQSIDFPHLAEYLSDMASRDRREVESRLWVLMGHLLKWQHQPQARSRSLVSTILRQRWELQYMLSSPTLRSHAGDVLTSVYETARQWAVVENWLEQHRYPGQCPYTLEDVLETVEIGLKSDELSDDPIHDSD